MKKFIFLALAIFTVASCNTLPEQKKYNIESAVIYGSRFTLDGHDYIEIYRITTDLGYDNCTGYVHDPECLKKDLEEWGLKSKNKNGNEKSAN